MPLIFFLPPEKTQIEHISKNFKQIFLWIGKIKNQIEITQFQEPLKLIQ